MVVSTFFLWALDFQLVKVELTHVRGTKFGTGDSTGSPFAKKKMKDMGLGLTVCPFSTYQALWNWLRLSFASNLAFSALLRNWLDLWQWHLFFSKDLNWECSRQHRPPCRTTSVSIFVSNSSKTFSALGGLRKLGFTYCITWLTVLS